MTKPLRTKTSHVLPFNLLDPAQFERLCLWIVEREGYLRPEALGEAGSDQGRDVIAYRPTDRGEQLWYFQCKRYQRIGPAALINEVQKYNKIARLDSAQKPFGIVFITSALLSARAREKVREFCGSHDYQVEFWARAELDMRVKKYPDIVEEFFDLTLRSLPKEHISIANLPSTGSNLFGREIEIQALDDAWSNSAKNIVVFVGWGGIGKTALVNRWLKNFQARDNYRGAERVYAWSFYCQHADQSSSSSDLFIEAALIWFGDSQPKQGSPWEKGQRLARFVRRERTLLVLDGLEPLQYPPGPREGRLRDPALQSLLVELAAYQPGLCVVSTRERVADLDEFEGATVEQYQLPQLSADAGIQLLRALQVQGDPAELEAAVNEFGGHALALTLLGGYLADVCDGEIERRNEIDNLAEDVRKGNHAVRVMQAYEKWLGEGPELAVLRLLGLFDRAADAGGLLALRSAPAIPGLTESLQNLTDGGWKQVLAKLQRIKLLFVVPEADRLNANQRVDSHPLVREHFKEQVKRTNPDAWREANSRLYDYLRLKAKKFPTTLEEMSPLYAAIVHGCAAEKYQEAWIDIYWNRIQRGNNHFSWHDLGAYGADLEALAAFFETPWQPIIELDGWLMRDVASVAAFDLQSLGRLEESSSLFQASLEASIRDQDWANFGKVVHNLTRLYLTIGDLSQALIVAQRNVAFSENFWIEPLDHITSQAQLGHVYHVMGRFDDAERSFRVAEQLQAKAEPHRPLLHKLAGFQHCDFLLDKKNYGEVQRRVSQTLEWVPDTWLTQVGLANLALGRSYLIEMEQEDICRLQPAEDSLRLAVKTLRSAGSVDFLVSGLLAFAMFHRYAGNLSRAEQSLAEVFRLATSCGMKLFIADYHLESSRLELAQNHFGSAKDHWLAAKASCDNMGYHRRFTELNELARRLDQTGS